MADRATVARNFPPAWIEKSALANLPQKVQSLLQRIGPLDGLPQVSKGPSGLQALAYFQTVEAARDAVQTLHGTDLRTGAERRSANFAPPQESERFWLRIAADAGVAVPGAAQGATPPPTPAARTPATTPDVAPRRSRIKANGVYLSPLPQSWAEADVKVLATPYGSVTKVKIETLPSGERGALIDYSSEASSALAGLNGLTLMGKRLRCVMQEELEPAKPTFRFAAFLDELPFARPAAEPRLDDRELFLELPKTARTEESARSWLAQHGDVEEVFLLLDPQLKATGKAYARFSCHAEALKALKSLQSLPAAEAKGAQAAAWSESERALGGTRGSYGLDLVRRLGGDSGARMQEVRNALGLASLSVGGADGTTQGGGAERGHLHFVIRCENQGQVEQCRTMLAADLAKILEVYTRDVLGSVVLKGFPVSWSEKEMKYVFAPFGALASVALEEEKSTKAEDQAAVRIAYVKFRNESAAEKAVANLHQTKVGDGDLVEECVVSCQRWCSRAWSDGSVHVGFFVDQVGLARRPLDTEPGPQDCELYVQNLPLRDMNAAQLREYFEGFGEVDDLHIIKSALSEEPTGEGYVRFRHHRDAARCIEALNPAEDAEPSDLMGAWSESERVLQRKANCYRFSLIAELVRADGSGLRRIKEDAKLQDLWLMSGCLQQKDKLAPPLSGRQLQFVGRAQDQAGAKLLREVLGRTLEDVHNKVADRLEKRKRKAEAAAQEPAEKPKPAAEATNGHPAPAAAAPGRPPAEQVAWPHGQHAPPPAGWPHQAPPSYWGGHWQQPPPGMAGPPPGYGAPPATGSAWAGAAPAATPQASVFEVGAAPRRTEEGEGEKGRSRSRRGKHRSSGDAGGKDRRRRGASGERRHRRRDAGAPAAEADQGGKE